MTVCAIHQPNFMPWIPYFDKIWLADVFVFLDQVQYPKSGNSMGSWCNRVSINMNGDKIWFTCPVIREHGAQFINKVKINYSQKFFVQWMKTLETAYSRYKNFSYVKTLIMENYNQNYTYIADYNIYFINKICEILKIKTKFIKQSELEINSSSNQLLIDICHAVGAKKYLSGIGAINYMDDENFTKNNINVIYQNQEYNQEILKVKEYSIIHYLITNLDQNWKLF